MCNCDFPAAWFEGATQCSTFHSKMPEQRETERKTIKQKVLGLNDFDNS